MRVLFIDNDQGGVEEQWKLSELSEKKFEMIPFSPFSSYELATAMIFREKPDILVVAHKLGSCITEGTDIVLFASDRFPHIYIIGNAEERSLFASVRNKIDAYADRDPTLLSQACLRISPGF